MIADEYKSGEQSNDMMNNFAYFNSLITRRSQKNYKVVAEILGQLLKEIKHREEYMLTETDEETLERVRQSVDYKRKIVSSTMDALSKNNQEVFILSS